ncbi:GNAT family N-acetyltransferase [Celerinatantimonas diazotrophica]|uniref:Protein ElaA n=1 Tax=Celerinatantimonas diazotrophica TaxID=412034 RepID=A0A4R1J873_9GAMM|nr:GNAT family N-acetyltransferase [Celerinatantimonas diazotrophica]TCK46706.1 ElaA protein [Celerinatantimonas diazotrophica]CAG9295408.1 Protein ElaA [Celerinatantimonas diazotrophica]
MFEWACKSFCQLSVDELYQILKLRVDVFVVEQHCPYPELDGHDTYSEVRHLMLYQQGKLSAYARLLAPGMTYPTAAIGRVIVAAHARGEKLGRVLMNEAIDQCKKLWPEQPITIEAQAHLQAFYESVGFRAISDIFLEDGIEHRNMQLD